MNEHDIFDAQLDAALNELPQAPLPEGLIANVMAQIAPQPQIEPFRLRAVDFWLALTITFCLAYMLFYGVSLDWDSVIRSVQAAPSMIESVRDDWQVLTVVLVSAEILITGIIYLGYALSSSSHDFEITAA